MTIEDPVEQMTKSLCFYCGGDAQTEGESKRKSRQFTCMTCLNALMKLSRRYCNDYRTGCNSSNSIRDFDFHQSKSMLWKRQLC